MRMIRNIKLYYNSRL